MANTSMITRVALLGGLSLAVALSACPVVAADAPATSTPPSANGPSRGTQIEEVVVTARKRTERLLDVPVSANALSSKAVAKYATTDLTSVGNQIPQVSIDHASSGAGYEEGAENFFLEGAYGGPIADGLSARVALRYSAMFGGYVKGVGGPLTGSQLPAFQKAEGLNDLGSPYGSYPGERNMGTKASTPRST